jgi:glycosyl hydrolase family 72 (putative glucanosyltransferase)
MNSLSEYGCTTNGRDFGEIGALMSDQMTEVYSGGLMYEYTMEENKFGIVQISGKNGQGSREELPEFASLSIALNQFAAPTGAPFVSTSSSVACPTKDDNWMVESTLLPAMPQEARAVSAPPSYNTRHAKRRSANKKLCSSWRRALARVPASTAPARRTPAAPRRATRLPAPARPRASPTRLA